MVAQVQTFACLIPAGTPASSPAVIPTPLGQFEVNWVEWEVPAGANGVVGFYLATLGQQVIPFRVGNAPIWIVSNNTHRHWDLDGQMTSGAWELVGYNTGNFNHTVTLHYGLTPTVPPPGASLPAIIPPSALSS